MKILVVTQYFWPEQFRINDLCVELANRGHEITVYTGLPNYPEGRFYPGYSLKGPYKENWGKIKIIRAPLIPRGKNKSLQLALNFISFFKWSTMLAPFLVRGKFDKIFVYEPSPITVAIPAIFISFFKRIPMILWVTDLWPESLEATGVVKNKTVLNLVAIMVKWIYKHTDRIFITSKGFKPRLIAMGVPEHKIKYWPQWAESFFNNQTKTDYVDSHLPQSGFKIIFAGNIGSSQDFPTLIESAKLLSIDPNIHFIILGDGLMKKWAENEIQKLGLGSTFHFLGKKPVETMPYYFSHADALLVSLTDSDLFSITVPSKVQSYLASGKPIIASLNGEGAAIIEEWKAGLTAPATHPKILAAQIKKMSEMSKIDLKEMGDNALACYLSEFERNKLITELEVELRNLK
jgi:colanic acid biosynthesis glycosyl transferase WcaI